MKFHPFQFRSVQYFCVLPPTLRTKVIKYCLHYAKDQTLTLNHRAGSKSSAIQRGQDIWIPVCFV